MGRVSYDGKRLIPAPQVSFSKITQRTDDGETVGSLFNLTIIGTILTFKGSPSSSGTFWTIGGYPPDETISVNAGLAAVFRKQEAIRQLFSVDGKTLEFQSADGSAPIKCNPRILDINFQENIWFNRFDYTIECEADVVYISSASGLYEHSFGEYISSASESWSFETNEDQPESTELDRTYLITHTISAQGKRFFDELGNLEKPAWEQARDYVLPRLGFDRTIALSSGVNNLPDYYSDFNHIRNENIDKLGGSYSVTETFILASGNNLETFTVSTSEDENSALTRVSIDGSIRGLDTHDTNFALTSTRYNNAKTKFDAIQTTIHSRAQSYSGKTLNIEPVGKTVARNPFLGTIDYTYEFDTRPSNLITGTKSEVVSVINSWNVDVFAAVPVLGRLKGPVLQALNSKEPTIRSISIELVFGDDYPISGSYGNMINNLNPRLHNPQQTELQDIVDSLEPVNAQLLNNIGQQATVSYVTQQNENWNPREKRYSYNTEWIYE